MSRPLNVLIPMAGQGKRFRRAGYGTYKPFVPISGKPMIQYVLDAFPAHVTRRVIADRSLLSSDQLEYLARQPGVVLHFVDSHELGPAYTIHQVRDALPLDEAFFIAYCDIYWTWDFSAVERQLDADGVVFTRRQFHPHLVASNYSAFCRSVPDDEHRLLEIREKASFTGDWMREPLSIGCFYIRDGHAMARAVAAMVAEERTVSGEFFPSLMFNDLLAAGQTIWLEDVDFFVHWGVPAQLQDLQSWVAACHRLAAQPVANEALNVCCMGGLGTRMKDLAETPKPLMPLADGEPMFRYVARRFGCRSTVYIVNGAVAPMLAAQGVDTTGVLDIGPPTNSQLATLQQASGFLRKQTRFYLTSCDAFGLWNSAAFEAYLDREQPDAVIFTFEPTLLQGALGGSHTYVETSGSWVTDIHIKHKPTEAARGLAGFFWFNDGAPFDALDAITGAAGQELCADHILKHLLIQGKRIGAFPLDAYLHLGSSSELQEFRFWWRYHTLFPASAPSADRVDSWHLSPVLLPAGGHPDGSYGTAGHPDGFRQLSPD